MDSILNLDVKIKENVNNTLDSISKELNENWTRNAKAEVSIKDSGSEQYVFNYKNGNQNNSIYLIERDGELQTTNIVPADGISSIPISECNDMLRKFEDEVLNKTNLKYSLHN